MEAALQTGQGYGDGADPYAHGAGACAARDRLAVLLARVAAGDGEGMAALYDETSPTIYGLLTHMLGAGATAEETLVEVYSRVWRRAASYRPGGVSPIAWLVSTARQCALGKMRPDAVEGPSPELSKLSEGAIKNSGGAETQPAYSEAERAREALRGLAPREREALRLSYFSGLRKVEAAFGLSNEEAKALVRDALEGYAESFRGAGTKEP
jgi:RNA polymerase sigma-70 factor (ECF subfamily)